MNPPDGQPVASPSIASAALAKLLAAEPGLAADRDAVRIARAPGRVNLIGEHTDYNEGFVLPAAIDLGIAIAYVPTADRRVELSLAATGERATLDLDDIGGRRGTWLDYVAGTAWALSEAGQPLTGFRGALAADLPSGAGLSSSAALELVTAWALSGGAGPRLEPLALARVAQRGENAYVGVQSGLMDQFASACGVAGSALLLDCRTLEHRPVALPADLRLVVCHSGVTHRHDAGEYNLRRAECDRAVAALATLAGRPLSSLRDVDEALLRRHGAQLDPIERRRAEHVVGENGRVLETEAALRSGDRAALGRLFAGSHASMRDLFEITTPEIDALVEIATGVPGVVAARMTGGGFGGCTINLVMPDAVGRLRAAVERDYTARTGRTPRIWEVAAAAGAGPLLSPWSNPG
ncbi:MAG: galactokinase [Chloroflexota bacterium]|nr:galactokinase [Chloroflexota bacterium]